MTQMCSKLLHICRQPGCDCGLDTRGRVVVAKLQRRSLLWAQPHGSPWGSATSSGPPPCGASVRNGLTNRFDASRGRLEKWVKENSNRIELPPARTGRPAARPRRYAPDELVRFDARIPARLAKQLYDVALTDGRSVTAVHADLLAAALECRGAAMD